MNFKVDEENELIFVFANPIEESSKKITKQLNDTHRIFLEKYSNKINSLAFDTSIFSEFDQDLLKLNIVPRKYVGDVKLHKHPFWEKLAKKLKTKRRHK